MNVPKMCPRLRQASELPRSGGRDMGGESTLVLDERGLRIPLFKVTLR